jgi:hypothetical protein
MTMFFSRPKPPKIEVPATKVEETPPPPPPPPLPPPAKEESMAPLASAEVKRREQRRGRKQTILTNPLGVAGQNTASAKTLVGQ